MHQRHHDRRCQHRLRDDHRRRRKQQARRAERARRATAAEKARARPRQAAGRERRWSATIIACRPRKRLTARYAPKGAPIKSAIRLAVRLTRSDSATMPASSGSSRAISAKAETMAWVKSFIPACWQRPEVSGTLFSSGELRRYALSILGPKRENLPRQRLTRSEQNKNIDRLHSKPECPMSSDPQPDRGRRSGLEAAVDQAIAACGGDQRPPSAR